MPGFIAEPVLAQAQLHLEQIDELCVPSVSKREELLQSVKDIFDFSVKVGKRSFGPFEELLINGMDTESIWEEVRSRNGPLTKFIKKKTSALIKTIRRHEELKGSKNQKRDHESGDSSSSGEEEPTVDEVKESDEFDDDENNPDNDEGTYDYSEDDEEVGTEDVDVAAEEDSIDSAGEERTGDSAIENYDSDGMEAWLDKEEELEEKHRAKMERREARLAHKGAVEEGDSDSDEDDEMLAARALYEDEDEDDGAVAKFSDYFVGDPKGDGKVKGKKGAEKKARVRYADDGDEEEEEEDEEEHRDDEDDEGEEEERSGVDEDEEDEDSGSSENEGAEEPVVDPKKLSAYEKQKRKIEQEIKGVETELMGSRSWELRGELAGKDRPENSLLEIHTEIERASKPAPLVTQEHTSSLEEMIIKRITDGRFDDVQVREQPTVPTAGADDFTLSQEKSRVGLGEVYAQDFLAKSMGQDATGQSEKESEAALELKALFHKVIRSLDALAHFHYTPKPVVAEASLSTVQQHLPALALEDVTPMTEGYAGNLAPEEVHGKKRGRDAALMADAELTSDDRKRLRNASKATRRKERKAQGYLDSVQAAHGKGSTKYEAQKTEQILRNDRRVVSGVAADENQYAKSGQFFEKLQSQAQAEIAAGRALKKKKKDAGSVLSSAKIKS
jgi:U3 small nucleolar RNA-associated protein MPP10